MNSRFIIAVIAKDKIFKTVLIQRELHCPPKIFVHTPQTKPL
jgi:hypothetical protein